MALSSALGGGPILARRSRRTDEGTPGAADLGGRGAVHVEGDAVRILDVGLARWYPGVVRCQRRARSRDRTAGSSMGSSPAASDTAATAASSRRVKVRSAAARDARHHLTHVVSRGAEHQVGVLDGRPREALGPVRRGVDPELAEDQAGGRVRSSSPVCPA